MVQAVSRRPFTAVAMVHFQASPCEIREKKSHGKRCFYQYFCIFHYCLPTNASYSSIYHRCCIISVIGKVVKTRYKKKQKKIRSLALV